jgi:hypothetical protein
MGLTTVMMVLKIDLRVTAREPELEQTMGMSELSAALIIDRHAQETDRRQDQHQPAWPTILVCQPR